MAEEKDKSAQPASTIINAASSILKALQQNNIKGNKKIDLHSQNLSATDASFASTIINSVSSMLKAAGNLDGVSNQSPFASTLKRAVERLEGAQQKSPVASITRKAVEHQESTPLRYPLVARNSDAKQAKLAQNWASKMIQLREDARIGLHGRYVQASDDWQYAIGADTGVSGDFSYLRETEKDQSGRLNRIYAARDLARSRLDDYRIQAEDSERIRRKEELDDERLHQSRRSISIHRKQAEAMRKYPWVKTLVEAGLIQKKELPKIAKTLSRYEKVPFIGKAIKHPAMAGLGIAASIYALISSMLSSSDKANATSTSWWAAENIGGKPNSKFSGYAYLSGLGYKDQLKLWGELSQKYGDPMKILGVAGQALENAKPGVERTNIANAFGLSTEAANIAMLLPKGSKTAKTVTEAIRNNARYQLLEDDKTLKLRSGSSFTDTVEGLLREWVPGSQSIEAREALKPASEAKDAANSSIEYERHSPPISNSTQTSIGGSMTISIGNLNVEANSTQELLASIEKEAGKRYNIEVINWADSSRLKV